MKESRVSQHLFMSVFGSLIKDILNDTCIEESLKRIDTQPVALFQSFDKESPSNIKHVSCGLADVAKLNDISSSEEFDVNSNNKEGRSKLNEDNVEDDNS